MNVTRKTPLNWDPMITFEQYVNQSEESYNEQRKSISNNIQSINKFRMTSGDESLTYTKNVITYGAPGTGKSFIG